MFIKILVPTDGSELSLKAARGETQKKQTHGNIPVMVYR